MMRKQTNTLLSALAFAFASATVSVPSMLVANDAVAQEQKASEKKTRRVPTLRGKVYEQLARAQTAADEGRAAAYSWKVWNDHAFQFGAA